MSESNRPVGRRTVVRIVGWLGLAALAVVLGFGMAWVAMAAASAVLPPFRFPDDDTLREYGPVLLAYATWALTSLIGTILAWRCMRVR